MIRTQKTRIYPTPEQALLLEKSFSVARYSWNIALQESIGTREYSGYKLRNKFVELVKPNRDWLKEVSKEAYANSILDLGTTWKSVFASARGLVEVEGWVNLGLNLRRMPSNLLE